MQKLNFHNNNDDAEVLEKVNSDEPKEWTADELHQGAQDTAREDVDWNAREEEIEDAINEDFDRTYADYEKEQPFYKRWWFWLIAILLLLALIIGLLVKTGHMPGMFKDTNATTVQNVSNETKLDGPLVTARDFVLPEDAEVIKGEDGKWGVYLDESVVHGYNGIASNSLGTWYIKDGFVDFTFTGYVSVNGSTYKVTEGKVDIAEPVVISPQGSANTTKAPSDNGAATDSTDTSAAQAPQGQEYADGTEKQQDALASAVDYINQMAFSRDWLIAQLVADGFDTNDAAWAADHTGANWNEQAYKKALEYLKLTSFNHKDMVDQLLFEGFTADQAEYGATKAGL